MTRFAVLVIGVVLAVLTVVAVIQVLADATATLKGALS